MPHQRAQAGCGQEINEDGAGQNIERLLDFHQRERDNADNARGADPQQLAMAMEVAQQWAEPKEDDGEQKEMVAIKNSRVVPDRMNPARVDDVTGEFLPRNSFAQEKAKVNFSEPEAQILRIENRHREQMGS